MPSHVDTAGLPDAPPLLLVHGSVVTRKMWLPQLRGLADRFCVIAPDLPGHGVLADTPFSFDAAVRSLADVIDREAHGRAMVAGVSLGGYLAMQLAAEHSDRVTGLVLSGCSVNFTGVLGLYLRCVSTLMRWGVVRMDRTRATRMTRRVFPPELTDVADAQMQAGVYPEPLAAAFAAMARTDFVAMATKYRGPVLILNGEKDTASRRGEGAFAAALRAKVLVLAGAGHACNLDRAEAYNNAVRDFADEIGWSSRVTASADSLA